VHRGSQIRIAQTVIETTLFEYRCMTTRRCRSSQPSEGIWCHPPDRYRLPILSQPNLIAVLPQRSHSITQIISKRTSNRLPMLSEKCYQKCYQYRASQPRTRKKQGQKPLVFATRATATICYDLSLRTPKPKVAGSTPAGGIFNSRRTLHIVLIGTMSLPYRSSRPNHVERH